MVFRPNAWNCPIALVGKLQPFTDMFARFIFLFSAFALVSFTSLAQQSAVKHLVEGSRTYFRIDPALLRSDLDTLYFEAAALNEQLGNYAWADALGNGTNPGVDVDFFGYEIKGAGGVTTSGTFGGDSLVLNKDAEIAGRLEVVGVATIGDSLWVEGTVVLSDSLRVVKAVAMGSRLHVSGVSAFGDSIHVVGNVDFDALFHVAGAATFGSEVAIAGELSVQDSVSFASTLEVSGVLVADSIVSEKVLNARIRDLANHDTDGLAEGSANRYFTDARAQAAFTSGTGITLNAGEISIGQSVGITDDVSFAGIAATATVTADSLSVTDVINGQVSSLGNHDTDGLTEGSINLYFTDSRARASLVAGTGVTYTESTGTIAIGQPVGPDDDVAFANVFASATVTANSLSVADVIDGQIGDISNHNSDNLPEGNAHLYFTAAERLALMQLLATVDSLIAVVDAIQNSGSAAEVLKVGTSPASDVEETVATLNGFILDDGGDVITATGFRWGQAVNLSDAQDLAGSATSGLFSGNLTGLTADHTYYFTAFAINGEGTTYGDTLSFTTASALSDCGTPISYAGYNYSTVQIGSQCWFQENLQTAVYNDESLISIGLDNTEWVNTTEGAATVYGEGGPNEYANLAIYGRLYNWYAVNSGKLCPSGWHVPTDSDWLTLTSVYQGNALKSAASDNPAWDGTNSSGFSGLPGGFRNYSNGNFGGGGPNGTAGFWWGASPYNSYAWYYVVASNEDFVNRNLDYLQNGYSVRCIRD